MKVLDLKDVPLGVKVYLHGIAGDYCYLGNIEIKSDPRQLTIDDAPLGVLASAGASIFATHTLYYLGTADDEEAYFFDPPPEERCLITGFPLVMFYNPQTQDRRYPDSRKEWDAAFQLLGALPDDYDDDEDDADLDDEDLACQEEAPGLQGAIK